MTNTPARQLFLTELGHEEPTILLTNHPLSPAGKRVERYARRMPIENGLADAVDFFHLEALSSALRLKVDFDVTLTGVATGLYRMIARKLPGDEAAKGRQIFRHFWDTSGASRDRRETCGGHLTSEHNPVLIAAGLGETTTPIPWCEGRRLALRFR